MSISGQFSGLDMQQLIGAPLNATCDASLQMAQSTAQFIEKVGFDAQHKTRTAQFGYIKKTENPDGTISNDEMNINIPMLAIVPIPNLQVDEVNVLFDMEVKETESSASSIDGGGSFTAQANFGIFKASVSGSVSTHSSNTRSSDNSAKYHVDVRASNQGTPEGLARVLDIMSACIAPETIGSQVVDESGKALQGSRKEKAERIKTLRADSMRLEAGANSARETLSIAIERVRKEAISKQNKYTLLLNKLIEKETDEEKQDSYRSNTLTLQNAFNDFCASIGDKVDIACSLKDQDIADTFFTVASLKGCTNDGKIEDYTSDGALKSDSDSILVYFKAAIDAKNQHLLAIEKCNKNKEELHTLMYGGSTTQNTNS